VQATLKRKHKRSAELQAATSTCHWWSVANIRGAT
jgi:hypothetical protein